MKIFKYNKKFILNKIYNLNNNLKNKLKVIKRKNNQRQMKLEIL